MVTGKAVSRKALGGPTAEVLVFGGTSMVGSHFVDSTARRCATAGRVDPRIKGTKVERFDPLDMADPAGVARYVQSTEEPYIVNFAARTDVDGIERERPSLGGHEGGPAWTVNALTPGALAAAAQEGGKHLIQISTDFVFDGLVDHQGVTVAVSYQRLDHGRPSA